MTTQENFVSIPLSEYEDLKDSENLLLALESAGVDNWEGYGYAMEFYQEMKGESDDS